ncbi:hypothetical protein [Paenibacillus popilliae]|uniref:hypothetical protein n=1 Tax=Paenibacillus popilliae TaxID=78057 RepID=UPI0003043FE0|nr:hypothetical protein [Paenibacillus popilliae]
MAESESKVIDYRVLYERLKDVPATRWTREMELFSRLYLWRQNDPRDLKGGKSDDGCT